MSQAKSSQRHFAHYARYYDLLYAQKDYVAEARFVHSRLRAAGLQGGELLELGCGTGRHAFALSRLGWQVDGYDRSPEMVARARRQSVKGGRKPSFGVGDMVNLRTGRTYDGVISLFHVLGYQTSNRQLTGSIQTAAVHLRPGGLFLFDFWFGPAVLTERPSVRVTRVEDDRIAVTRVSEPALDAARNVVTVDFDIAVSVKATGRVHRIKETHRVRYFFLPELEQVLDANGFEVLAHGRWMTRAPLDFHSWYGWLVARRCGSDAASVAGRA